ncbi:MAG TPA: hypothetical protein DCL35_03095 [Candidatus Omnitrophica bacterium]|nr:hypothetical protein [Candidatus Omnitrophota bacterium]
MRKRALLLSAFILFISAAFLKADDFLEIHTPVFTVYCDPSINLDRLYKKINRRRLYFYKSTRPDPSSTAEEKMAFRVNLILEKVKEILGMYPASMNFKIKIFKDQVSVTDAYRGITGRNDKVKAFYVHKLRTIFTSEQGVTDSVLAHEMGHLLQNYYFVAPPSAKISELLSIYVDTNLEE